MKRYLAFAALAIVTSANAQQSFNFAGPIASIDAAGDPDNVKMNVVATGGFSAGRFVFSSATLTEIATLTQANEARIRVRNSAYTGASQFVDLQPFATTFAYTGSTSLTSSVSLASGFFSGRPIAPGSTWSFEFFESAENGTNSSEQNWTNLSFTLNPYASFAPPAGAIDLGTIGADGNASYAVPDASATADLNNKVPVFYKFTVGALAADSYLDIDVSSFITGADSEIALYRENGALVASDDDDGPGTLSALSFGAASPARGPIGNGTAGNGRDGGLEAGTYYLALSQYNVNFAEGFAVTSGGSGTGASGKYTVNFRTNLAAPVPEPATMAALGFGALALLKRRRKTN